MSEDVSAFPTAGHALAPLRRKAEAADVADLSPSGPDRLSEWAANSALRS